MERLDNAILIQYTGLKDKSDVEIFEGDAVKSKDGVGRFTRTFIVCSDKFKTGFKPFVDIEVEFCCELCEVIGNIHANLELLK